MKGSKLVTSIAAGSRNPLGRGAAFPQKHTLVRWGTGHLRTVKPAGIRSPQPAGLFCLRQEGHLLSSRKGKQMKRRDGKAGEWQKGRARSKGRCEVVLAGM